MELLYVLGSLVWGAFAVASFVVVVRREGFDAMAATPDDRQGAHLAA